MARSPAADPPVVRRAVLALLLTALAAFALVGSAAALVAGRIAEADALDEAARTARAMGDGLFAPALPAVLAGDTGARTRLDTAVRDRARDGTIVRVKVWDSDSVVVYSDEAALIGRRFTSDLRLRLVLGGQDSVATMSGLHDEEHADEAGRFDRLVEAYVPLRLDNGRQLTLEIYSADHRVVAAGSRLRAQLVPFALVAMLVLLFAQLPVAMWLVRRVGGAQAERARLLRNALSASDRERRSIARDLHDGVVPELAGVGYTLESLAGGTASAEPERTRARLMLTSAMVRSSVAALRTLMIDIYPPNLTAAGLHAVIEDLARPLREAGVEVVVRSQLTAEPSPDLSAALYRGARECLRNVARHADADHVRVELSDDAGLVRLRITDDGVGLPAALLAAPGEFPPGHLGIRLLRETTVDLGGTMHLSNRPGGGADVVMELPAAELSDAERLSVLSSP